MVKSFIYRLLIAGASLVSVTSLAAEPLTLDTYNPGDAAIFPVSSTLVIGTSEVLLIDAQFQRNDARALVEKIRATGKPLTTVYISHSDPDFYFGLDVVQAAFPDARILATAETVAAIKAKRDGKLAHWGPILKDNAPQSLVLPEALTEPRLHIDGHVLEITGPEAQRSFVWIPALKTVVGGIPVMANIHVWVADTATADKRQQWYKTLDAIESLAPHRVIPGHFLLNKDGSTPDNLQAVAFTRQYLQVFEKEAATAKNAGALISAMQKHYPELGEEASLELSAKVIKGELQWH